MAIRRHASLETLPPEILQDVFFLTDMDPNMPRASSILAHYLSDRFILCRYTEKVFQEPTSKSSRRWELVQLRLVQSRKQQTLFSLRWMSWEFFSWYLSWKGQRHLGLQHRAEENCNTLAADTSSGQGWIEEGQERPPWMPQILCPMPTKLLKGPFTKDKLDFLRCLLLISSASVDWADFESVRLSTLAKRQAILDRNLDAVHLFSRVRRLAKAPTLDMVKFAVLEGGCERSIVLELMTAARAWGHRRWEDMELDAWVAQERAKGNLKAKWLGLKLMELRSGEYPDPDTGNYEGDQLVVKHEDCAAFGIGTRFRLS